MGWWKDTDTNVIGDPVLDYMDALLEACGESMLSWTTASIPAEVRERLVAIYVEGIQREPTESELRILLEYAKNG